MERLLLEVHLQADLQSTLNEFCWKYAACSSGDVTSSRIAFHHWIFQAIQGFCRDHVVSTPAASYLGGPRFKSQSGDWSYWVSSVPPSKWCYGT